MTPLLTLIEDYGRYMAEGLYESAAREYAAIDALVARPLDMVLHCPKCGQQHVDADNSEEVRIAAAELDLKGRDWEAYVEKHEWTNPPHKSHLCHGCKTIWRPAGVPTNGVAAISTRGADDTWPAL